MASLRAEGAKRGSDFGRSGWGSGAWENWREHWSTPLLMHHFASECIMFGRAGGRISCKFAHVDHVEHVGRGMRSGELVRWVAGF